MILIRVLKYWARENGYPRTQLNSYALSLMMIFALQRSSPPVLPCLQDPGLWPKNMDWYKQQHPSLENDLDYKFTRPWKVRFTPAQSLKPTKNREGTGESFVGKVTSEPLCKIMC